MQRARWIFVSFLGDIILINLAIFIAFYLRFPGKFFYIWQVNSLLSIVITVGQIVIFYFFDLYNYELLQKPIDIFLTILRAVIAFLVLIIILTFFFKNLAFSRIIDVLTCFFTLCFIFGFRYFLYKVMVRIEPVSRLLIVGTGKQAIEAIKEFSKRTALGLKLVGVVSTEETEAKEVVGLKVLGRISEIAQVIKKNNINRVVVATSVKEHREFLEQLPYEVSDGVSFSIVPDFYEILLGRVNPTLISEIPLIETNRIGGEKWFKLTKRFIDLLLAMMMLIIGGPFFLLVPLLIKISSKGPVFYRQERVGRGKRIFNIIKFRTMVIGAEDETGPILAIEDDHRVTKVGRFLRRTRIDELPQLFNIIKGEMSFVGPRPERPVFVEEYVKEIPGYDERFGVKPGITGLAQISGSYAISTENKLKYDLIYICNQSLILDLRVLMETIKVVLTGRGAR